MLPGMPYPTLIAAHRGGLFLWPENSATAFRNAAQLALEQAECDVHLTADGEVVVMHDATLDRMTDGRGPVGALSASQFARLRVRGAGGEAPPTLAECLGILAGSPVAPRIEIKSNAAGRPYPGIVAKTLALVDAAGERRRSWIIGFHAATMAEAQQAGGLAGVAWLLETATFRDLGLTGLVAAARDYGFPEVGMHESVIDAEVVAALRAAGIGIGTWGGNHAPSIRRMLDLGVDIFATDDPPLAIRMRQGG
jgi:glycerophosphoryl diester phosphodiesterase